MEDSNSKGLYVSELVELAYKIAKESFKDQVFTFSNIWSKVWKGAERFSKEKVEDWIGYFYVELSTDPRFSIFGFNKWKLKEFMTASEIRKLDRMVFYEDAVFEEEYEAYVSSSNKKKEIEIVPETSENELNLEDEESDSTDENNVEKDDIFESEEE